MPEPQYLVILRRPGAARLLLPTLVARIPDSIAATAIAVLVRSATGSYFSAGFAAGPFGAGAAVSTPFAGRALDRLGQRRLLPLLAIGFAAALTALALASGHSSPGGLDALAVAAGLSRPPVEAALRAMWPKLVPPDGVAAAYALDSTVQELIWIGRPLLLALLLATGSRQFPLLACAAASVVGTAVYAAGLRPAPASREVPARAVARARGGGGGGEKTGGLAYGNRDWRSPVEGRAAICLALFGAMLILLAAAPNLAILALLMVPLGVPLSPWLGSLSASVQRAVPVASSTEAFAWTFAVVTVSMAAGNACGGVTIQAAGTRAAFLAAELGLAGAGWGSGCWHRAGQKARHHDSGRRWATGVSRHAL